MWFQTLFCQTGYNLYRYAAESFAGLAGNFVVSPIVYAVVFQFYRREVLAWAESLRAWGGAETVISAHFPVYTTSSNDGGAGAGGGGGAGGGAGGGDSGGIGGSGGAVRAFVKAFDWARSADQSPAEYADLQDLASLQLVVRILRALKAVPPER
jgi:hypothetical protein